MVEETADKKEGAVSWLMKLPGIKKIESTVFGISLAPLVCYFTGWVPKEDLISPFGILCWVPSLLVMANDAVNMIWGKKP